MRVLIVLASVLLAINAATDRELWLEFKQNHGRDYRNLREEQLRFTIFQNNLRVIEDHNEKYEKGDKSYYMGVNRFTDMTPQEFGAMLNYSSAQKPVNEIMTYHVESGVQAPEEINWVSRGVVTGIKDQSDCGSCWAFSVTGGLEGAYAIRTGNLVSLSEQNLMDCSREYGTGGCNGGYMEAAFNYVKDYGIESESDYPYTATDSTDCKYSSSLSVTSISGYVSIPQNENSLFDAVGNVSPITVSINANHFQNYAGGVFDEVACDEINLNHGVLVVGYGTDNNIPYWLVKNSWGIYFGENGYVRMIRNKNNQCGIANDATYPYF